MDKMSNITNIQQLIDAREEMLLSVININGINKPLYNCNVQEFAKYAGIIDLNKIQDKIYEAQRYKKRKLPNNDPNKIRNFLFKHQKEFVKRFINSRYGGLFFDTGTGKTLTILELIRIRLKPKQIVLYICPKNVFSTIAEQINQYTDFTYIIVTGDKKNKLKELSRYAHIHIINYESLLNNEIWRAILMKNFTVCVLDECHKIGNYKNKTTKKLLKNAHLFKSRWVMSGTPFDKPQDVYSIITFLDTGLNFGTEYPNFLYTFLHKPKYQLNPDGTIYLNQWNKKVTNYKWYLLEHRRNHFKQIISSVSQTVKIENCLDMPEKIYQKIDVILIGEDKTAYIDMLKKSILILENTEITSVHKVTQINYLRQITGGSIILKDENGKRIGNKSLSECKLYTLKDYIKENHLYKKIKAVIVASFIQEIYNIYDMLCDIGFKVGIICGRVKPIDRDRARRNFSDGDDDFIILQSAAGIGIDGLQKNCRRMYFYSRSYSYKDNYQIEARLFRQGLKNNMIIVDFISYIEDSRSGKLKSTIDSEILKNLEKKKETAQGLIEGTIRNYKEFYDGKTN